MPKIAVISTPAQYYKFRDKKTSFEEFTIFCDNERCYDFLKKEGIPYEILEEALLKDRWNEINGWGCAKAAGWIRLCRQDGLFRKYGLPSVIYLYFSLILILILKNYLYAKHLVEKYNPSEVFVFESSDIGGYPTFSGNSFLNIFLKEAALARNIRVELIPLSEKIDVAHPDTHSRLRQTALRLARSAVERVYAFFVKPKKNHKAFMAYGSLKHLGHLMIELKKRQKEILLYDDQFHLEQYLFALRHGAAYLIPRCFPNRGPANFDAFTQEQMSEIRKALKLAGERRTFSFGSYDFTGLLEARFFPGLQKYLEELALKEKHYESVLAATDLSGVLLEEDFGGRAFFAEFMRANGVSLFCLSHANYMVDFQVPKEDWVFAQSLTFVNSEHEKMGYLARGWKEETVVVSGLPRYDELRQMVQKREPLKRSRKRLLYCAGVLWAQSPDAHGYLGYRVYALKSTQLLTIQAVLKAIKGLPIELVIKPHYYEDEPQWRRFVKEAADPEQVKIVSSSDDFFQCLAESDAMLLSYWSTAIIEAGMAGVPIIYLDLESQNNASVRRYAESGFCEVATNDSELRNALEKFCERSDRTKFNGISAKILEYHLGKQDGKNTERVVSLLLETLEKERRNLVRNS